MSSVDEVIEPKDCAVDAPFVVALVDAVADEAVVDDAVVEDAIVVIAAMM